MPVRVPIKVIAPLLFGVPVLLVGILLSTMWNRQARRAATDLAGQNIEQIHEMASAKIADVLSTPVRVCQVNQHLVRSRVLDPKNLEGWRLTFVEQIKAFDMLSSIAWGAADGRAAWITSYADGSKYWALKSDADAARMKEWHLDARGEISGQRESSFEFDLTTRPWFQAPRDAEQATWCEPYIWVGGVDSKGVTLGISYGIPIYNSERELEGVVDADYSLNDLSEFLASLKIGKTGIAILTTSDAKLLAASGETQIATDDGELFSALESSNPLVAAAARYTDINESKADALIRVDLDGHLHFVRASQVGQTAGLNWSLLTIVPEADFVADIQSEFRRSSLISLAAVAAAVALGVLAARWLVAPILKLVTAVRRIGQGDLQTRVEIRHAPEYANLADEINKMTADLQDRMRMQKSLSLAMEVQRNLLPTEAPHFSSLDLSGHSTYCDETGGDYYDFLDVSGTDHETAVLVIGDVMGHGVAAALLMATARGILRSRCAEPGSLADFLNHLNDMLVVDTQGERFMTMLLVTISPDSEEFRWASAGHGPPIVYDPATNDFHQLEGGGLPLGLVTGEEYVEYKESGLPSGSIILVATDGLEETMNEQRELYGKERLLQLLRDNAQKSADEISQTIRQSLASYRGPLSQDDDLTFVVAKLV